MAKRSFMLLQCVRCLRGMSLKTYSHKHKPKESETKVQFCSVIFVLMKRRLSDEKIEFYDKKIKDSRAKNRVKQLVLPPPLPPLYGEFRVYVKNNI